MQTTRVPQSKCLSSCEGQGQALPIPPTNCIIPGEAGDYPNTRFAERFPAMEIEDLRKMLM